MTPEQRKIVTHEQINYFFASYYTNWRLHQVLTAEKLYKEKFDFYNDIINETKQFDDNNGDSTIAQEISNGLMFEAIANCVQYIEDLFALLRAGENKDYFIKNIVSYDAGQVINYIKRKFKESELCELFYIPYTKEDFENKDTNEAYPNSIVKLDKIVKQLQKFYFDHQFCYNQYKHGLTVALRPFGKLSEEQINKTKANDFKPYLAVFDNLSLSKLNNKKDRLDGYVLMPCFTDRIRPHIQELMNEDNFVRYIRPPSETSFETLKEVAYLTRDLINIFSFNVLLCARNEYPLKVHAPSNEIGQVYEFSFPLDILIEIKYKKIN